MTQDIKDLTVLQYELLWDPDLMRSVVLERVRGHHGERWAIRQGEMALGKEPDERGVFHFCLEPLSSNRTAQYLANHRHLTPVSALQFWIKNRERILATAQEQRNWYDWYTIQKRIKHDHSTPTP